MTKTVISAQVKHGESNGIMTSHWYANDELIHVISENSIDVVELSIQLPCKLKIVLHGKNSEKDVIISNGNVVKDKYLEITSLSIARYPVNVAVLQQLFSFTTLAGETQITPFFYDNGEATAEFFEEDPLLWHLKHNNFIQF